MSIDLAVGSWDTEAINVDTHGPTDEQAIPTWGLPIEAACYFAGISNIDYPEPGDNPFAILDVQTKGADVSYRAYETGGYLSAVHEEARNSGTQDTSSEVNWRRTNKAIGPQHVLFASAIREYYKSVFTMWKMQDRQQQELFEVITREDQQRFKQREIGMLSKIVQAYEIDIETDRCVMQWGKPQPKDHCPTYYNHQCTAVGAFKRLGKGGISVFVLTEHNELVELILNNSPINGFFIDTIRRQQYTGFKFSAMGSKLFHHINGKTWTKVYKPKIEVA